MEDFHDIIVENANVVLKRRFEKRMNIERTPRPIWFTAEIETEIKKRRSINRRKRYARPEEIENVFLEYMDQKNKVKRMVKEAITEYEVKMTNEIKNAKDSGRKMWKYINKLKGVDLKQKVVDIYNADGTIMEKCEMSEKVMGGWKGIYQMQGDNNELCWGEDRRTCYLMNEYVDRSMMELTNREAEDYQEFPEELLEHYEMMKGNIERRSGGYRILVDRQPYVSLRIPQEIAEHMEVLKIQYRGDEIKYRMEISRIE